MKAISWLAGRLGLPSEEHGLWEWVRSVSYAGHFHCAAVWGICMVALDNTMFPGPVSGDTTFIMSSVISPGHPEYRDAASAEGEWALT